MEQYIDTLPNYMVLVCCYTFNHSVYISDALNGFTMQHTNFPYVVVMVDDASNDGEQEVIKEYIGLNFEIPIFTKDTDYAQIIYTQHKTNKNCYIAIYFLKENHYSKKKKKAPYIQPWRNKCKYEALCEGDDYWVDPLKLQKQVDFLEANPECSISFCKVQCVSANNMKLNQTIPFNSNIKKGIVTLADYIREEFRNGYWTFHTSSFVFRSDLLLGYSKIIQNEFRKFPYGDMPILLYCLLNGNGCYISDIGSCYRMLSGGYNSKINTDKNFKISQERKLIYALRDFDRYTNYLYHKDVEIKIKRSNYIIESTIYGKIIYLKPQYWILLLQSIKRNFFSLLNKSKNNETI